MNIRMNKFLGGMAAGAAVLALSACLLPVGDGEGLDEIGNPEVAFETLGSIQNLLESSSCTNCHGAGAAAGLNVSSFEKAFESFFEIDGNGDTVPRAATTVAGQGKLRINPDDVESSHILERLTATSSIRMPPSGSPLSDKAIARIRNWITAGAPIYDTTSTTTP